MANLHVDEKAYIAVFIIHHTKNEKILDEIELNAWDLFSEYTPATLAKEELDFFDKQKDIIVQAALPHNSVTPEKVRKEELQHQDEIEEKKANEKNEDFDNEKHNLQLELRRALKTVEVMGHIIRNRSGSLEKPKLKEIYKEAIKVHLKILSSFFATIKEDDQQKQIITFISNKIMKINNEAEVELNEKERQQLSKIMFWNLSFFFVFGVIDKIIHSLGSDKLTDITKQICSEIDTPASFLVQHGIFMWYDKNLNTKEIEKSLNSKKFSAIAKEILKFMVSRHCLMHPSKLRDRQKINQRLGIPIQKIKKSEPTQKKS